MLIQVEIWHERECVETTWPEIYSYSDCRTLVALLQTDDLMNRTSPRE